MTPPEQLPPARMEGSFTIPGRVLIAVIGTLVTTGILFLFTLGAWVIEMRGNRFTDADGQTMERRVYSYHRDDLDRILAPIREDIRILRGRHERP